MLCDTRNEINKDRRAQEQKARKVTFYGTSTRTFNKSAKVAAHAGGGGGKAGAPCIQSKAVLKPVNFHYMQTRDGHFIAVSDFKHLKRTATGCLGVVVVRGLLKFIKSDKYKAMIASSKKYSKPSKKNAVKLTLKSLLQVENRMTDNARKAFEGEM